MIYQILIDRFNGGWSNPPQNENKYLGGTLRGITEKMDYRLFFRMMPIMDIISPTTNR